MTGLRYSPLHVTEFCGEMQGKFKVCLTRLIILKSLYCLNLPPRFFTNHIILTIVQLLKYVTDNFLPNVLNVTGNISLVVKGNKCQINQMDASEYKELKSKTIDNNKLWILWTTKPLVKRSMHILQQRVLSINSQLILRIGIKLSETLFTVNL